MIFSVNYFYAAEIAKQVDSTRYLSVVLALWAAPCHLLYLCPGAGKCAGGSWGSSCAGAAAAAARSRGARRSCRAAGPRSARAGTPGQRPGPGARRWGRGGGGAPRQPGQTPRSPRRPCCCGGNIYSFCLVTCYVRCHGNQITKNNRIFNFMAPIHACCL